MSMFTSTRLYAVAGALSLLTPLMTNALGINISASGSVITFTDVQPTAWYATYVHDAAAAAIVNGYLDAQGNATGKFGPSDNVTVAQALKIAIEGAGYNKNEFMMQNPGGNMGGATWARPYIAIAMNERFQVLNDNPDFNAPATRAQVAAIFADAFKVDRTTPVGNTYSDVSASTTYAGSIDALSRDEVVGGDTNAQGEAVGLFRPTAHINRAETVKMIMQARQAYGEPGTKGFSSNISSSTSMSSYSNAPYSSSASIGTATVVYTDGHFSPSTIDVSRGTVVTFKNQGTGTLWISSADVGSQVSTVFDTNSVIAPGQSSSFTFNQAGNYQYKNSLQTAVTGMVVVE